VRIPHQTSHLLHFKPTIDCGTYNPNQTFDCESSGAENQRFGSSVLPRFDNLVMQNK
jgi:hypothetical protein